jgi:Radical SAM superfamily/Iron-sulfur cluster-binding domain
MHSSKTFCMHPFTGLATREDGAVKVCCRSQPIGWIQNESIEEIWNNSNMKEVRRQVLNNERPDVCVPCFNLEEQGVESLRQRHIKNSFPDSRINLYPRALDKLNLEDFSMPFEFPTIEIKINNLCNLKCRMCNPLDSTQWKDWESVEEFYAAENNYLVDAVRKLGLTKAPFVGLFEDKLEFWENLEKLLPYFRRVEFAGGEPLMDPTHYKILDLLSRNGENIEIKYATNGTVTGIKGGRTIHDYWPKFKRVSVNVSIDGLYNVYEYIRGNGDFETVKRNVEIFKSFPNVDYVVGACTVQVGNIMQLPEIIPYFLNEMGIVFYSHRVNYPNVLSAQCIPKELKLKVIRQLEMLKAEVVDYSIMNIHSDLLPVTLRQIQDNINFLQARDLHQFWSQTIAFNARLDITRNQGPIEKIIPEFMPYV